MEERSAISRLVFRCHLPIFWPVSFTIPSKHRQWLMYSHLLTFSEGGMTRDRYSMASTGETFMSNDAGSQAAFLGRPSQSYASMSMQGSPNEQYQPQLDSSPAPPRGPFRGGRDSSPASSESADHYADRYRSYSGDVRDESAPILTSNYGQTSPMDESFPARTGMTASQRYPDGKSEAHMLIRSCRS